jgi:hypothetical protein
MFLCHAVHQISNFITSKFNQVLTLPLSLLSSLQGQHDNDNNPIFGADILKEPWQGSH